MVEAITKYIKEYETFEADRVTNGPLRAAARKFKKELHDKILRHMVANDATCIQSDGFYAVVRKHTSVNTLTPAVICEALGRIPPDVTGDVLVATILEELRAVRSREGKHAVVLKGKARNAKDVNCGGLLGEYVDAVAKMKELRPPKTNQSDVASWMLDNGLESQPLTIQQESSGTRKAVVLKRHLQTRKKPVSKAMLTQAVADAVQRGDSRKAVAELIWQSISSRPKSQTWVVKVVVPTT